MKELRGTFTRRFAKELKALMKLTGIDGEWEVIRKALQFYDYCKRERKEGAQILIRRPNEKEDLLITNF